MKNQKLYVFLILSFLAITYQNCSDVRVTSTGLRSDGNEDPGNNGGSSSFNSLNNYFSSKTTHVCVGDPLSLSIRCWGQNNNGQLGNGNTSSTITPQPFSFNSTTTIQTLLQVTTGNSFTCALIQNGTVFCSGRFCDGTTCSSFTRATGISQSGSGPLTGLKSIASNNNNNCGIWPDNSVRCWGSNYSSTTATTFSETSPHITPITTNSQPLLAKKIAGGGEHFCAITLDDKLYCWGSNTYGSRGDGTTAISSLTTASQTRISASQTLEGVQEVRLGERHSCAYAQNKLYCWGGNDFGQLGDGSTSQRNFATEITLPPNITITDFSLGFFHTCLSAEENIYCWGGNDFGQLGNNSITSMSSPNQPVFGNIGADAVLLASTSSCSSSSGQVRCWGVNQHGQLGHPQNFGNTTANPTPLNVNFPP